MTDETARPVPQGTEDSPDVREQIARTLHDAATGRIVPDPTDPTPYGRMARQVYDEVVAPLVEQLRQARRMLHNQRVELIAALGVDPFTRDDTDALIGRVGELRWLHAEAQWQRDQLKVEADHQWQVRREMGRRALDTDTELTEAVDMGRWLVAEAQWLWKRAEADETAAHREAADLRSRLAAALSEIQRWRSTVPSVDQDSGAPGARSVVAVMPADWLDRVTDVLGPSGYEAAAAVEDLVSPWCMATPDAEPDVFEMFHRHALEVRQTVEIMRASRDHMDSDDRHTLDGATAVIDDLFHHDDTPAPLRMPRFLAEPKSGAAEPIRINRAAPVEAETPATTKWQLGDTCEAKLDGQWREAEIHGPRNYAGDEEFFLTCEETDTDYWVFEHQMRPVGTVVDVELPAAPPTLAQTRDEAVQDWAATWDGVDRTPIAEAPFNVDKWQLGDHCEALLDGRWQEAGIHGFRIDDDGEQFFVISTDTGYWLFEHQLRPLGSVVDVELPASVPGTEDHKEDERDG